MGLIDIFLFYSQNGRPKTQRKSITASQSNQSCWERGRNGVFLCPNRKDRELNICTFPLVCLYSRNAVNVVQHLTFISQRTLQVSSYHFSHLFIAAGMIKSAVHHFWEEENDWICWVLTLAPVFTNTISLELLLAYCFVCLFEGGWSQLMKISIQRPPSAALLSEPIRYLLWRLHSWTALLRQLRC